VRWLKSKIPFSIAVTDILNQRPGEIDVVRQMAAFHLPSEKTAENSPEIFVTAEG
jgi:hypothetical protein